MLIELKSFKHYPDLSEETLAFSAVLYLDGEKVGKVSNDGKGGSCKIEGDYRQQKRMAEYCATLPGVPSGFDEDALLPMSRDFYLELLAGKMVDRKALERRHKAGKNVFTKKGDPDNQFILDRPYSLETTEWLAARHPDLKEILNPRLEKPIDIYEDYRPLDPSSNP
jgi:hypothetical protein